MDSVLVIGGRDVTRGLDRVMREKHQITREEPQNTGGNSCKTREFILHKPDERHLDMEMRLKC